MAKPRCPLPTSLVPTCKVHQRRGEGKGVAAQSVTCCLVVLLTPGADLRGAYLCGVDLRRSNLTGARMKGARGVQPGLGVACT